MTDPNLCVDTGRERIVSPLDFVRHMKTERSIGNLLIKKGGIYLQSGRVTTHNPVRITLRGPDRAHRIKIEARSEHPIQIESRSGPIESRAGPVKIESRSDPSNPYIPDRAHRLKSGPIDSKAGPSNQDRIKSGPIDTRSTQDRTHRIQSGAASFG